MKFKLIYREELVDVVKEEFGYKFSKNISLNTKAHSWSAAGIGKARKMTLPEDRTFYDFNGKIISEGIAPEQNQWAKEKGGVIVFSTDVNAWIDAEDGTNSFFPKIQKFFKKKYHSIINRLKKDKKLSKSITKSGPDEIGWSIGNNFKGRYKSESGDIYDENSTTVEIIGVDSNTLVMIATSIAQEFMQEEVLLKDNNNNEYIIIDRY